MYRLGAAPQEAHQMRRLCNSCTKSLTRGWLHLCGRCFLILEGANTVRIINVSATPSALLEIGDLLIFAANGLNITPADETARMAAAAGLSKPDVCLCARACRVH